MFIKMFKCHIQVNDCKKLSWNLLVIVNQFAAVNPVLRLNIFNWIYLLISIKIRKAQFGELSYNLFC